MHHEFGVRTRTDRLLPIQDDTTLSTVQNFRILVVPGSSSTLSSSSHVSSSSSSSCVHQWWRGPQEEKRIAYKRWLREDVPPTRIPVQMAGFPPLHSVVARSTATLVPGSSALGSESTSGGRINTTAASHNNANHATNRPTEESAMVLVPCAAVQHHVALLSQYETLVCPSLLCSPLYSPVVEMSTTVTMEKGNHNETEGAAAAAAADGGGGSGGEVTVDSVSCTSPLRSHPAAHSLIGYAVPASTARLLQLLAKRAFVFCMPIHEVTLFFSLSLLYLDAVAHFEHWGYYGTRASYATGTRRSRIKGQKVSRKKEQEGEEEASQMEGKLSITQKVEIKQEGGGITSSASCQRPSPPLVEARGKTEQSEAVKKEEEKEEEQGQPERNPLHSLDSSSFSSFAGVAKGSNDPCPSRIGVKREREGGEDCIADHSRDDNDRLDSPGRKQGRGQAGGRGGERVQRDDEGGKDLPYNEDQQHLTGASCSVGPTTDDDDDTTATWAGFHKEDGSTAEVSFSYFSSAIQAFKQRMMERCVDKDAFLIPPDPTTAAAGTKSYNFNSQDYRGPATSTAAAMILLLMAADELEQRHSETVTSQFPIGCGLCGAAWSPRELKLPEWEKTEAENGAVTAEKDSDLPPQEEEVSNDRREGKISQDYNTNNNEGENGEDEEQNCSVITADTGRRSASTAPQQRPYSRRRTQTGAARGTQSPRRGGRGQTERVTNSGSQYSRRGGGDAQEACFTPFTARRTARASHYFHLPPLPKDPVELFFLPLWERVLTQCLTVRGALANVREELLQETSQQWKAVVRADEALRQRNLKAMAAERHKQQQQQEQTHPHQYGEYRPCGSTAARAAAAAASKAQEANRACQAPKTTVTMKMENFNEHPQATQTKPMDGAPPSPAASPPPSPIQVEDGTLQSMGLRQTSFVVRAPVEWNWRWTPGLVSSPAEPSSSQATSTAQHALNNRPIPTTGSAAGVSSPSAGPFLHRFIGWRGGEGKVLQYGMPAGMTLRQMERYAITPFVDAVFRLSIRSSVGAAAAPESARGSQHHHPSPPPLKGSSTSSKNWFFSHLYLHLRQHAVIGPVEAFYTVEELADFLCRVGAPMRRAADPSALLILSRPQVLFIRTVLQRERPDLFLSCSAQGMMEWRVRASSRTVALLHLTNNGMEARLGIPSQLSSTSTVLYPNRRPGGGTSAAAVQRRTEESLQSALREVWRGGFNEALAYVRFLYRVRKTEQENRSGNATGGGGGGSASSRQEMVGMTKTAADGGADVLRLYRLAGPPGEEDTRGGNEMLSRMDSTLFLGRLEPFQADAETAVPFLLPVIPLRRTEESALYRMLQSHPNVIEVLGCGARQLLLRASDGALLLRRKCGTVVTWSLEECYQPGMGLGLRRPLREPRRAVRVPYPLPLPAELQPPSPQEEDEIRGGWRRSSSSSRNNNNNDNNNNSRITAAHFPPTTATAAPRPASIHRDLLAGLLSHYFKSLHLKTEDKTTHRMGSRDRQYSSSTGRDPSNGEETAESGGASYSHAAEQAKTNEEGKTVESKKCSGGRSSAGYALEAQATADRNDMSLGTFCFSPPAPASCCGATPLRHESSATPPLISSYYPRTVLFPSDRALVLFVLRHHPTYYTTIRRCGIKEIYVSWEASSTRFTGALPTAVVDHHTETRHITTTTTTSTITTTANIGKEAAEDKEEEHKKSSVHSYCGPSGSHPVLLVEYVCGAMSPCYTWSECFLSSFPFTLQGYQRMV